MAMVPSGQRELDYIHHCDLTIMVVCSSVPVAASSELDGYIETMELGGWETAQKHRWRTRSEFSDHDVLCTISFYQSSIS